MPMTELVLLAMKFVALTLVGWRLGWLLIEDDLSAPLRAKVGFWVEAVLVAVVAQFSSLPYPALWPFALNAVSAPLHHMVDRATRASG